MAETQPLQKRIRDEVSGEYSLAAGTGAGSKRFKPYDNILNFLDEEVEDEAEQSHELSRDLSAIFTTLQKELSSTDSPPEAGTGDGRSVAADEDEGLKLSVMRHLFEASDDELGIPNRSAAEGVGSDVFLHSDLGFGGDDGLLWELEDEAANYYTVLQSELFM